MGSTPTPVEHTNVPNRRRNAAEKAALIAAVAAGMTQAQAAQHFGVHENTAQRWCAEVAKVNNNANPLVKTWKEALVHEAAAAVRDGLRAKRDPYRSADIGVKVLTGLGEFTSGNTTKVDAVANIVVTWGRTEEPQGDIIDVNPAT